MNQFFSNFVKPLIDFIFVPVCFTCNKLLLESENRVCTNCLNSIKKSSEGNRTIKIMNERFSQNKIIDGFFALYLFEHEGVFQKLMHMLKYENRDYVAVMLGNELSKNLLKQKYFLECELIIPIPLNKIKLRERGYNQANLISNSVSKNLKIPVNNKILSRKKYTLTQTKLNLQERKENVKDAFIVNEKDKLKINNKNILLIDDVITTGSTIEEAALCLKNSGANKIYAASLGVAELHEEMKSEINLENESELN